MFGHGNIHFHNLIENAHAFNLFHLYFIYLIYLMLEQFCVLDFGDAFIRSSCQFRSMLRLKQLLIKYM